MGEAGFLDTFVEEGEVDVDPGDEVEELGHGLDGAKLGAAAAGADDGDVDGICHVLSSLLRIGLELWALSQVG